MIPSHLTQELAVGAYRQALQDGRAAIASSRRMSRTKALRYARHIRARGFNTGYQEGLRRAQDDCSAAIEELCNCYHKALDGAQEDIQRLARELATQIIDSTLTERPETLALWVQRAVTALKNSKTLHLTLHTRYAGLLSSLSSHLPAGVSASLDPAIDTIDFKLEGESGGIEFAWRNAISTTAAQSAPNRSEAETV